MNKCFITKLPSSVDNDSLPVLGQLRFSWLKQSNLTDNDKRAIGLATNDSITVKVSGAHFTDSTLTSNLGNTKTISSADNVVYLYVSNDADAVLTIDNKYSLTSLILSDAHLVRPLCFDIEDIKYCTNLTELKLSDTQVSGDISAVSNLTNLTYLSLSNTQVSGDISVVSNLTNLTYLSLPNTQVSGDISAVSKLTKLTYLGLPNTQVSGDISAVSKLTNLTNIYLINTQVSGDISAVSNLTNLVNLGLANTHVSGDISAVSKLTKLNSCSLQNTPISGDISVVSNLTNLNDLKLSNTQVSGEVDSLANLTKLIYLNDLNGLALTGDVSKLNANTYWFSQDNRKVNTNFTWTANGRKNVTLIGMGGGVPFDTTSMDNMLIDQATCTVSSAASWHKVIVVKGTRTSASDAAVTAIRNKGVTITGAIKQA